MVLLENWLSREGSTRPAVIDAQGACYSYGAVVEGSRRIAKQLLGLRRSLDGERVALMISPGTDFVEALFGVLLAGGCALVLSPLHPPKESAYFCDDAGVGTILASADLRTKLGPAEEGRTLYLVEDLRLRPRVDPFVPRAALPSSAALQLYTSGTTGKPKGAVLSHLNIATQQELVGNAWGFSEDDILLHALPLHHMHGLVIAMMTALGSGATVRFLAKFDARTVWNAMEDASVWMAVPTMYQRLLAEFDAEGDLQRELWTRHARNLRLCTSGSAALPVTLGGRWREIAGSYPVERFGMTEVGVGMTNPLEGARKPGTVGRPLPTVETRIVDEQGSTSRSGELWIRGPSVFSGYWQREEATRDAFSPDPNEGAPWFRTGDTVTTDDDGYVRILGRTSVDILKSGGYKLSALEIEEVLRNCPGISDVAVVGIADEAWGERVVACVIAKSGCASACTSEIVRAWGKDHLASYKLPREVLLFEEFPRNAMGKVMKPELLKQIGSYTGTRTLGR